MTTLRNFISARETEIKAQIKALRTELGDLKVAKAALDSQQDSPSQASSAVGLPTIKDMIRSVLKSNSAGLTSTEILAKIQESFGRQIERTSLSPQLSRMKEDGEVTLTDNLWFYSVATEKFAVSNHRGNVDVDHNDANDIVEDGGWDFEDDDSDTPF